MDSDRPQLSRVFTGQHLDDQSHYQKEREESIGEDRIGDSQSSPLADLEKGNDGHDVEAPLEKIRSSKSAKDPDLVRIVSDLRQLHS